MLHTSRFVCGDPNAQANETPGRSVVHDCKTSVSRRDTIVETKVLIGGSVKKDQGNQAEIQLVPRGEDTVSNGGPVGGVNRSNSGSERSNSPQEANGSRNHAEVEATAV